MSVYKSSVGQKIVVFVGRVYFITRGQNSRENKLSFSELFRRATAWCVLKKTIGHFRIAFCLYIKTSLSAKPLTWKWFRLQVHFHANQSHFQMNGFALRLVLKQRHKGICFGFLWVRVCYRSFLQARIILSLWYAGIIDFLFGKNIISYLANSTAGFFSLSGLCIRPFRTCISPLFQNESCIGWETIHIKILQLHVKNSLSYEKLCTGTRLTGTTQTVSNSKLTFKLNTCK